jgi:hypothetical protein
MMLRRAEEFVYPVLENVVSVEIVQHLIPFRAVFLWQVS